MGLQKGVKSAPAGFSSFLQVSSVTALHCYLNVQPKFRDILRAALSARRPHQVAPHWHILGAKQRRHFYFCPSQGHTQATVCIQSLKQQETTSTRAHGLFCSCFSACLGRLRAQVASSVNWLMRLFSSMFYVKHLAVTKPTPFLSISRAF